MFSQASVILSTICLMPSRSLLILVTARSVRILLECFLVTGNVYEYMFFCVFFVQNRNGCCYYPTQTKFAKVMFLHVSVCSQGSVHDREGVHGRGVCMAGGGDVHGTHAPLCRQIP